MKRTPAPVWLHPVYRKRRYHHGQLHEFALRRAREIVAAHGPDALTLRGLARELGVTAAALVYHFGSRDGLRSQLAAKVLEDAAEHARIGPVAAGRPQEPAGAGAAWIRFAAENPNLYRLASGEGWRAPGLTTRGIDAGSLAVPSPRRVLDTAFRRQSRRLGLPRGDEERACELAFSIHGLALARLDGVEAEAVDRGLHRLLQRSSTATPGPG